MLLITVNSSLYYRDTIFTTCNIKNNFDKSVSNRAQSYTIKIITDVLYDPGEIRTHLYGLGDHCSIQINYRVAIN